MKRREKSVPSELQASQGSGESVPLSETTLARIQDYLRRRPHPSQARLSRFLRRECGLSPADARSLSQAIVERTSPKEAEENFLVRSLSADAPELMRRADLARLDWAYIAQRAGYHDVAALLYCNLAEAGLTDALPSSAISPLESAYRLSATRNARLYAELRQVLEALHKEQIQVILLKGIALAPLLYRDVASRAMSDFDLLVRVEDVERAEAALQEMGYQFAPLAPSFRPPGFLRRYGGSAEYARWVNGERRCLDLHWRFTHSEWIRRTTRIDIIIAWETSRPWACGSLLARQLSPAYHLYHLALHFLKHKFAAGTLRWLADIDRLLRTYPNEVNTPELALQARACGIATALYAVLELCARLLGTPISPQLLQRLAPPRWRKALLSRMLSPPGYLFPETELHGWSKFALEFLLLDQSLRLPALVYRMLLPEQEWLISRYALEGKPRAYWRHRFAHLLKLLRSGEL